MPRVKHFLWFKSSFILFSVCVLGQKKTMTTYQRSYFFSLCASFSSINFLSSTSHPKTKLNCIHSCVWALFLQIGFGSFGVERWQVILANCILCSLVLSARSSKLGNGTQRWRITGDLGRLVKWGFQAVESQIQEPSLFYYNSNQSVDKGGGH